MAYEWREQDDENGSWLFFSRDGMRGLAAFAPTKHERARNVSLGWPGELTPPLIKQLQLVCWNAFRWSLPGRDDLVPQRFRVARPIDGSHQFIEGMLPPKGSDAVNFVVFALREGGSLEPPIFRIEFLHNEGLRREARHPATVHDPDVAAARPSPTANWGRGYRDLERVRDLPYGNVGLSLSRDALVQLEDDIAQLIAGNSMVVWDLADLREALRHVVDRFSDGTSSGGTEAGSPDGHRRRRAA